ncbi:MAG: hypothetical protein A2086_13990 [Spirochaetes bacterium GWD1_27_9]|nr:MAG: hypothetical protein A2Y34_03060 [Spirochaetes bacterium GWC1_27_15]OHD38287.1 MAG: hypothetical protein A2086_13990 [Spirochaetes bacterium GWD1_27_9]
MNELFDIIIIGSGAGGLTTAAFASQRGYKVLVLENHSIPGGYLHGFKRKGFFFDSAVYSIAGCGENGYVKYLLKKLGLQDRLNFIEYNSIYKLMTPSDEFVLPVGYDNFLSYFSKLFPEEKNNIKSMLEEMVYLYDILETDKFGKKLDDKALFGIIQKWGKKSYKEFIDSFVNNEKLRKALYSLWLFCALPESKASSLYAVLMLSVHIIESSHYIEGGSDKLALILADYIKQNGGELLYSSLVSQIVVENGVATSVKLADGRKYSGKVIISNASAKQTLQKMISNQDSLSSIVKRRIEKLEPSLSTYALYIAAKINKDVTSPFKEANQIFYLEEDDNDKIFEGCISKETECFKNFIITEIPYIQKPDVRTFNIYSLISYDRNADWKEIKKELTEKALQKVRKILGDYIKEIVVVESGTPKTFYRYTLNDKGAMYGFENTKDPYKGAKMDNTTGIKNLFLAGHWTKPGGSIYNAMTSGYNAFELAVKYLEDKTPISL